MEELTDQIGFIGGGNMAFAIGAGLLKKAVVKPNQIHVSGPNLNNLKKWGDIGANITSDNGEVVSKCDIIFICVKPHILEICSKQIQKTYSSNYSGKVFVSILGGCSLATLENAFTYIPGFKIIRTMPNTPMQVCEGCTVYSPGVNVLQQEIHKIHLILSALGMAKKVNESMIDNITSISGCGPAFVYTIIEALADGGVKQGIPREMAIQFAAQTVFGAAKTVLETGKHPAILRDEVCSPGGATICGVHELEKGQLRATLMNAVQAATEKSKRMDPK